MRYNCGHPPLCPILFPSHLDTLSPFLSFTLPLLPFAWFGLSSLIMFPSSSLLCILLFSTVLRFLVGTYLFLSHNDSVSFSTTVHHHTSYLCWMNEGVWRGWMMPGRKHMLVPRVVCQTFLHRGTPLFGMISQILDIKIILAGHFSIISAKLNLWYCCRYVISLILVLELVV